MEKEISSAISITRPINQNQKNIMIAALDEWKILSLQEDSTEEINKAKTILEEGEAKSETDNAANLSQRKEKAKKRMKNGKRGARELRIVS